MCSTKALLGGDGDVIADIYRERVLRRGRGADLWGWSSAYGVKPGATPPVQQPAPASSKS
jgi:formate dehydrogenase iron-sulfur subunit